jgi:hypothetical protein
MTPDQLTELVQNDVLRGRLSKYLVRECLRQAGSETKEIIPDVINDIDRLLGAIFASSEIVDALKEHDPVPEWKDPDWYDRINPDEVDQLAEAIKNMKGRTSLASGPLPCPASCLASCLGLAFLQGKQRGKIPFAIAPMERHRALRFE